MITELVNLVEANKSNILQMQNEFNDELKKEIQRDKESEERMQAEISAIKHAIQKGDSNIKISDYVPPQPVNNSNEINDLQ